VTEPTPTGPTCAACTDPAIVHWQRRLTADEIAAEQAKEQARRDGVLTEWQQIVDSLAGSDTPAPPKPDFGPLPDCADYTRTVYGCYNHAITHDSAALIHRATCTAPDPNTVPACNCTPEPAPQPDPDPESLPLPPGW
jgi:hypothetical protein